MEKVVVIIPDNNKGKYIAKGFSSAFKEFNYFVIEKKIYDLHTEELAKINPDIIFTFWSDIKQNDTLTSIFDGYNTDTTIILHCAELKKDIPSIFYKKENNYCFSTDSKTKKMKYIPAISPKDYKQKFKGYRYTISFAGNPAYENREEILAKIIYNFGIINIFCRSYDFYKSVDDIYKNKLLDDKYIDLYRESYRGYVETQKELSFIYSASKINIDLENPNKKSINYRCFETIASGGFLLAPYSEDIIHYLDDGKEFETYKNNSELIDKINFYLRNTNLARLITIKGKKNVVSNHSFYDRLKTMLKVIYYGKNTNN